MQQEKQEKTEINLQADIDLLKGRYANNLRAAFSSEEFVLDFSLIGAGIEFLTARIVVSPGHLRRIANYLAEQLSAYEKVNNQKLEAAEEPQKIGFNS